MQVDYFPFLTEAHSVKQVCQICLRFGMVLLRAWHTTVQGNSVNREVVGIAVTGFRQKAVGLNSYPSSDSATLQFSQTMSWELRCCMSRRLDPIRMSMGISKQGRQWSDYLE